MKKQVITEDSAKKVIGEKYCKWLDLNNLYWSDCLPYSMMEGWTNGWFSIIYAGKSTESLETAKMRLDYIKSWKT